MNSTVQITRSIFPFTTNPMGPLHDYLAELLQYQQDGNSSHGGDNSLTSRDISIVSDQHFGHDSAATSPSSSLARTPINSRQRRSLRAIAAEEKARQNVASIPPPPLSSPDPRSKRSVAYAISKSSNTDSTTTSPEVSPNEAGPMLLGRPSPEQKEVPERLSKAP